MPKESTKSSLSADLDRLFNKFAALVFAAESFAESKKYIELYQKEYSKIKIKHSK